MMCIENEGKDQSESSRIRQYNETPKGTFYFQEIRGGEKLKLRPSSGFASRNRQNLFNSFK